MRLAIGKLSTLPGVLGAELGSTAVAMLRPLQSFVCSVSRGRAARAAPREGTGNTRPRVIMSQPAARTGETRIWRPAVNRPTLVRCPRCLIGRPPQVHWRAEHGPQTARAEGFEPPTDGFGNRCSTVEQRFPKPSVGGSNPSR